MKEREMVKQMASLLICHQLRNPSEVLLDIYRVSQEECEILRESVPYVNPLKTKHRPLYLKA